MMHHDVWPYVFAAYAASGASLVGLAAFVVARLRFWAKKAREEESR